MPELRKPPKLKKYVDMKKKEIERYYHKQIIVKDLTNNKKRILDEITYIKKFLDGRYEKT